MGHRIVHFLNWGWYCSYPFLDSNSGPWLGISRESLQPGRHAEKRAPEIKRLREAAGAPAGASEKRWALLVLPQPLASKAW